MLEHPWGKDESPVADDRAVGSPAQRGGPCLLEAIFRQETPWCLRQDTAMGPVLEMPLSTTLGYCTCMMQAQVPRYGDSSCHFVTGKPCQLQLVSTQPLLEGAGLAFGAQPPVLAHALLGQQGQPLGLHDFSFANPLVFDAKASPRILLDAGLASDLLEDMSGRGHDGLVIWNLAPSGCGCFEGGVVAFAKIFGRALAA